MCLCVCPTLFSLTEFQCQARKYKTCTVYRESGLGRLLESSTDLPLTLQQVSDLEKEAEEGKSDLALRLISGTFLALDMKIETDIQELSITCLFLVTPGCGEWEQAKAGKRSADCLLAGAKGLLRIESRSVSFGLGVSLGDGYLALKDYVSSFQEVIDAEQSC